ncbi:hypothetical protein [Priestia endophytica]|uniref:hypothetical protein n=1 Tax=Priestia endophytica TaxID=135735 RepID=UPI000DCA935F|nr:hypothetical protein [Priestia endophytica]RAS74556.1 hypothetical protein A4R27_23845 [Priestia endophytica]RAS81909.1 hypothetical protein A4U60_13300 [Priestia endophytica]
MKTSPITNWENVDAYFTFGPASFGMWLSLVLAVVMIGMLIITMMRHEQHSFKETADLYPSIQEELKGSWDPEFMIPVKVEGIN